MLSGQPPGFPSNNGTIPSGTVTHPAASGGPTVFMQQAVHSLVTRVADFFRRKNGSPSRPSLSLGGCSSPGSINIIGLVTSDDDRRLLTEICSRNRWHVLLADTCADARIALGKLKASVILCDRDLPGRGWRETVGDLASSTHRTCILLVSEVVDTYLWNEVVRMGGYDVLSKPLREDEVVRAVRLASYWNSETRTSAISGK